MAQVAVLSTTDMYMVAEVIQSLYIQLSRHFLDIQICQLNSHLINCAFN